LISELLTVAGHLLVIGGLTLSVYGAFDSIENGVDWKNLAMMVGGVALAAGGLALAFGATTAAVGLLVGGLAILGVGIYDIIKNGVNLQNELLVLAGLFASGLGISILLGSPIPMLIAGLGAIALGIIDIVKNGTNLQNTLMEVGGILLTTTAVALKAAISGMASLGLTIGLAGVALAALTGAFLYISLVWDQMTGWEKAITIFTGLAAAILAAALAIAVFHASWSVGLAAGIIIGSIAAVTVAFAAVRKDIENTSNTAQSGMPRTSYSTPVGANPNAFSVQPTHSGYQGAQSGGYDYADNTEKFQEIIGLLKEIAEKDTNVYMDGQKVSDITYPYYQQKSRVGGSNLVR